MKKIAICLMLMLTQLPCVESVASTATSISLAPEEGVSIQGKWVAKVKSLAENMQVNIARHIDGCDMIMTLDENTMDVRCNIFGSAMFQGMSISVSIKAEFGADYTVEGDSLFFDYEGHDLDVDVYSVHVNADDNVRAMMDAMGVSETGIRDMLTDRLNLESFRQLMGYIGESARYELKDKKTLVLTDSSGYQLQFTRKKDKKKK